MKRPLPGDTPPATESAPMRRGRLGESRASMRRGPEISLRLLLPWRTLEAGPGGGPALCCLTLFPANPPLGGRKDRPNEAASDMRDLTSGPQRRKDAQV